MVGTIAREKITAFWPAARPHHQTAAQAKLRDDAETSPTASDRGVAGAGHGRQTAATHRRDIFHHATDEKGVRSIARRAIAAGQKTAKLMRPKAGDKTKIRPPAIADVAPHKWLTACCVSLPDPSRPRIKS